MYTSAKLGAIALIAASVLGAAANSASAGRLSVSNQNIRVTWRELSFQTAMATIICSVTLEGSFHARTFAKTAGALIGAITRAIANEAGCANGRLSLYAEPWHLTYETFAGTLPNVSSYELLLSRFRFQAIIPNTCPNAAEYGTATDNITLRLFRETDDSISSVDPVSMRNIAHRVAGGAFCPTEGRLVATLGLLTVLNSTTHIFIRLI